MKRRIKKMSLLRNLWSLAHRILSPYVSYLHNSHILLCFTLNHWLVLIKTKGCVYVCIYSNAQNWSLAFLDFSFLWSLAAMATHAALAVSRIPVTQRLQSKSAIHSFPAQCSSKVWTPSDYYIPSVYVCGTVCFIGFSCYLLAQRLEVAEFSGLRMSSIGGEASFFDAVAAQIIPKVTYLLIESVTVLLSWFVNMWWVCEILGCDNINSC